MFKDKPGGLVVDYLGLANDLRQALVTYTESGGTGHTAIDKEEAVAVMLERYDVCCALFHGFDWSKWTTGTPAERLGLIPPAQEYILAQENGKDRCLQAVRELSQAFALAVPHEETFRIRDDVGFFQQVRTALSKRAEGEARPEEDLDLAVRQIVSRAVASEGVIDIFAAAGLEKPDISILSEEFLAEVQGMPQRNLAVELLQKLLRGEVAIRRRTNLGSGPVLRRHAGADPAPLSEPGHRGGAGHRGAHPVGQGYARGWRQGRKAWVNRRRVGFLRCPGDQRQRRPGSGRRDPPCYRTRVGRYCPPQRNHRLDAP